MPHERIYGFEIYHVRIYGFRILAAQHGSPKENPHSPSMISQGRIGALVTAKPADRRAILEEAAGISGIHARRQEAETRLNAAENNLKRADELKKQQEKQLDNLKKQAEEATRYKEISKEIKKIEAGLYFLKINEIEKDKKLIVTIKKSDLAKDASDQRPEVFSKDNALDAKIVELDLKNRRIKLSPKSAQLDEEKSLIAKFGEGATKSGATLKNIFEKAIGKKEKKEK